MESIITLTERAHSEHRHNTRYQTALPAFVTTATDLECAAMVTNISLSGLQLTGDFQFIKTCLPNIHRADRPLPVNIQLYFEVPSEKQIMSPVIVNCGMIYAQRKNMHEFIAGCQFNEFKMQTDKNLSRFIELSSRN